MLPRAGELCLSLGQFLACGLHPALEVGNLLVAACELVRGSGEQGLQLLPLALCLGLVSHELVPAFRRRRRGSFELLTALGKPLLFGTRIGEVRLDTRLGVPHLLEAALGIGDLGRLGR